MRSGRSRRRRCSRPGRAWPGATRSSVADGLQHLPDRAGDHRGRGRWDQRVLSGAGAGPEREPGETDGRGSSTTQPSRGGGEHRGAVVAWPRWPAPDRTVDRSGPGRSLSGPGLRRGRPAEARAARVRDLRARVERVLLWRSLRLAPGSVPRQAHHGAAQFSLDPPMVPWSCLADQGVWLGRGAQQTILLRVRVVLRRDIQHGGSAASQEDAHEGRTRRPAAARLPAWWSPNFFHARDGKAGQACSSGIRPGSSRTCSIARKPSPPRRVLPSRDPRSRSRRPSSMTCTGSCSGLSCHNWGADGPSAARCGSSSGRVLWQQQGGGGIGNCPAGEGGEIAAPEGMRNSSTDIAGEFGGPTVSADILQLPAGRGDGGQVFSRFGTTPHPAQVDEVVRPRAARAPSVSRSAGGVLARRHRPGLRRAQRHAVPDHVHRGRR